MSETDRPTAWVLWWSYSDGSAADVERVYFYKERASDDFDLLVKADGMKNWKLSEVTLVGEELW